MCQLIYISSSRKFLRNLLLVLSFLDAKNEWILDQINNSISLSLYWEIYSDWFTYEQKASPSLAEPEDSRFPTPDPLLFLETILAPLNKTW